MTKTERVLAAAYEYGERYFYPSPLSSVELLDSGVSVGKGYENWSVLVESRYRGLTVVVTLGPDGELHLAHTTSKDSKPAEKEWESVA